jgi:hypothetical protein
VKHSNACDEKDLLLMMAVMHAPETRVLPLPPACRGLLQQQRSLRVASSLLEAAPARMLARHRQRRISLAAGPLHQLAVV